MSEALGDLAKEKDRLLSEHDDLKVKLYREYEILADNKRNFQQEVEALLKLSSKIKEYAAF